MEEIKQKILKVFEERGNEISTGDILIHLYPELKEKQDKKDKESKRMIAQIHRKLLYHINELVRDDIIRFSRFGDKGLKYFALNLMDGEEISQFSGYKKKLSVSRPIMPTLPIEGYESQGIISKYSPLTWIDKINSIIIRCNRISELKELERIFEKSFNLVNDCLCLENFDNLINKLEIEDLHEFLKRINSECTYCKKTISCIINLKDINKEKMNKLIESAINDMNTINFIFNLDNEELQENAGVLSNIISCYIKNKKILYVKNKRLQKSAYFIGSAGPYCLVDSEAAGKENCLSVACSQSSLIVDVEKFFSLYGLDSEKFSQLMINISKSFLSANAIQRKKSAEYFKDILSFDKKNDKEFMEFSRNYIRIWNFGLLQPGIDPNLLMNMINEAKKKIDNFAVAEETIYKSCGMPFRFKIAFSCAFENSVEKMSSAKYSKVEIDNFEDLYKNKIKKEILEKENVSSIFNGGNDVTFHRRGFFDYSDILREMSFIMNTYKFPLFSFNFKNLGGNMRLSSFV